jgi:hypothetical protein
MHLFFVKYNYNDKLKGNEAVSICSTHEREELLGRKTCTIKLQGGPRHRSVFKIKMFFEKHNGGMDCIHISQNGDRLLAIVATIMNLRMP